MNKLVSIIIPVYNGENFIADCLNSILEQTYHDYEIIVINDGSKDNTRQIVESFNNKKIKLFNIENNGVSNARNYGIKMSNGEFILFIDADDKIDVKTLEILVRKQEENNADIIRYNGYIQDSKGKYSILDMPIKNNTILNSKKDCRRIIELLNNPYNSIRCYSPLLFIKKCDIISFDTTLAYLEDKLFYVENMTNSNKNILFIDDALYYYNFNERSKTKDISNFKKNIKDILLARIKIKDAVEKKIANSDIIDFSILSLILYRIEYLASITSYTKFKIILKDIKDIQELNLITNNKAQYLNKIQNIMYYLWKEKKIIMLYISCRIKKILKELKR